MAKWNHKNCKGHVAAGLFDGKTFKKVCITEDQPDNVIEDNIRFAKEITKRIEDRAHRQAFLKNYREGKVRGL